MKRTLAIVIASLLLAAVPAHAQPGLVDQITQENSRLGSGCNAIGVAPESSRSPVAPTQEWLDEHAVCLGEELRLQGHCSGHIEGDRQFELCMVATQVPDVSLTLDCERMMLVSDIGPFGPDPDLTDAIVQELVREQEERDLPAPPEAIQSCTESPVLEGGNTILAAFDIDKIGSDFALLVTLSADTQAAILITEPREEIPV